MNETTETLGSASYDPGDNKLRFYPDSRLSKTDYDRAKSAGFKWAPKQELFVAPMWTPDREDLLIEWCREIGDEDKSLVDRAEERAERFEDYSDKRKTDADHAHKAVESICEHIPLGQPILVGHHSERHARKDAERIENGMRKAVKMWEQSQYWAERAKGSIRAAKYKERPDVRARRIKGIEADKRKTERTKSEAEMGMKFWNGKLVGVANDGTKTPIEITEPNRERICKLLGNSSTLSFYASSGHDGQSYYSGWDVLRPDEDRYKNCPSMTVAELQTLALTHYERVIARVNRWLAHYDNRLTYERAMMEADGGTVSDKKCPEVGGAVRCWCYQGRWTQIVKVNKVTITVLDNWGNGGKDFARTIEFDKIKAVMSKAEFETYKAGGGTTGLQPGWQEREHAAAVAAKTPDPDKAKFEAMRETVKAGVQVVTAPNLFPTPPTLAARMVELAFERGGWAVQIAAGMNETCRVLEPSAGTGNILRAIADACGFESNLSNVMAVEVNLSLAANLASGFPKSDIRRGDFLNFNGELGKFDRIVMNPPFDHGSDIKHILHACHMLSEGGRLVALCANGSRQREVLEPLCTSWEDLPEGTFKEQGTGVNVALLVIDYQETFHPGAEVCGV